MMSKEICANCGQLWGHMPYCPQRGNVDFKPLPPNQDVVLEYNEFIARFSDYAKQFIDNSRVQTNDIEPRDSYYWEVILNYHTV